MIIKDIDNSWFVVTPAASIDLNTYLQSMADNGVSSIELDLSDANFQPTSISYDIYIPTAVNHITVIGKGALVVINASLLIKTPRTKNISVVIKNLNINGYIDISNSCPNNQLEFLEYNEISSSTNSMPAIYIKENANLKIFSSKINSDLLCFGGRNCAGIGVASIENCGEIIISGFGYISSIAGPAHITEKKFTPSSAIGGGSHSTCESIDISFNGTIKAIGSTNSAGIGSGASGRINKLTISGSGTIISSSSDNGAGIGCGAYGSVGELTITGNYDIYAYSFNYAGYGGSAIGGGYDSSVNKIIIIGNGHIYAKGGNQEVDDIGNGTNLNTITNHLTLDEDGTITELITKEKKITSKGILNFKTSACGRIIAGRDITLENKKPKLTKITFFNSDNSLYIGKITLIHFENNQEKAYNLLTNSQGEISFFADEGSYTFQIANLKTSRSSSFTITPTSTPPSKIYFKNTNIKRGTPLF